jgi:hypothetical protein
VGSLVVDVAYKTAAGKTRVMPWNDLDPLAVADGSPYREFPWYLGQRNYSGMYWCAIEVKLVGYESLLELSRLLMADFDRAAIRIVSQPFQIKASIDGGRLTRIPDYLVLGEEEPLVIDVTRKARMDNPKYARLFGLTRRIVESRGWKYERADRPTGARAAYQSRDRGAAVLERTHRGMAPSQHLRQARDQLSP